MEFESPANASSPRLESDVFTHDPEVRQGETPVVTKALTPCHRLEPPTPTPGRTQDEDRMGKSRERRDSNAPVFLIIWWMSKNPYAAVFSNRVAAEAAANVRNAILVTMKGPRTMVEGVVDWYRRDEEGRPMPAEWRELMGQVQSPWRARPLAEGVVIQTDRVVRPALCVGYARFPSGIGLTRLLLHGARW